jgi:predicted membrane channel-forming protein YqfA (hemolysin III family)
MRGLAVRGTQTSPTYTTMNSFDRDRIDDLEDRVIGLEKHVRWLRIAVIVLAGAIVLLLVPPVTSMIGGVVGTLLIIGAVIFGVIVWIGVMIWVLDRLDARRKRT